MGFFDWFRRKESPTRIALLLNQTGVAQPTPRNYTALTREGYQKNVTVFRAINLIMGGVGGVEWDLFSKSKTRKGPRTEIETHPLLDLLERPNPLMGRSAFFQSVAGYFSIAGNSYIHAVGPNPNKPPMELWPLEVQNVEVIPAKNGYPGAYQYNAPSGKVVIPVAFVRMKSAVLHLKTFNPLNPIYGMSPLEAALFQIDQQNSMNVWNNSLLKNQATPSGVLSVEPTDLNPNGKLTPEQYDRLKDQIEERYLGSTNAGRPMLLEGGLSWQSMAFSPKDMEFIEAKNVTTREIANAYGVPPMLLNITGDNTYANYKEARLALYEDTIIPVLDFIRDELNNWLTPIYGDGLLLDYDKDEIEALAEKRAAKFTTIKDATFLTQNEKRAAAGYDEADGWDVFLLPSGEILAKDSDPLEPMETETEEPQETEDEEPMIEDGEENDMEEMGLSRPNVEVKLFNLLNGREKRASAIRQNKVKSKLVREFENDLKDDFRQLEQDLINKAKSMDPKLWEFALLKTVDEHQKDFEKTISMHIKRALRTFGEMVFDSGKKHLEGWEKKETPKQAFKFSQFVEDYTKRKTAKSITEIQGTTRKQVRDTTRKLLAAYEADPHLDLPGALQKEFAGLSQWRANNIARTETTSATNGGSLEAVKTLEIPGMRKEWVATIDEQTRDDSGKANHVYMNGTRVGLDEKFTVPPDTDMDIPGDPSAPPEQICNCRCVLVYSAGK